MNRLLAAILFSLWAPLAWGQGAILQGGPWQPGHIPQYVGQGSSQPIVQDGGPAGGGAIGVNPSEIGITARGTGTPPYAGQGTGPLGTNFCDYDAPITNPTGYHFLCLSPNAQGGGLLAYGAGGIASPLPLSVEVNGTKYAFPFVIGGIAGPSTTVVGHPAVWANTTGTLLADTDAINFGGTFVPFAVYSAGTTQSVLQSVVGSMSAPNNISDATLIFQKISTGAAPTGSGSPFPNLTGLFSAIKTGNGPGYSATALMGSCTDNGGWVGTGLISYCEGVRGSATVVGAKGSANAVEAESGNPGGVDYTYMTGAEANVFNTAADAPTFPSFDPNHFAAAFLESSTGTNLIDVGFVTNPNNTVPVQTGFLCAKGVNSTNTPGSGNGVKDTCVANSESVNNFLMNTGHVQFGLHLAYGHYSVYAITIPNVTNGGAIGALNAAGTGFQNLLNLDGSNNLQIGQNVTGVVVVTPPTQFVDDIQLGNAYVAGIVAQAGTLTLKDSTGTTYHVLAAP